MANQKIDSQTAKSIRAQHELGKKKIKDLQAKYSMQALADKHGISLGAVEKIIYRKTWKHVK